MAGRAGRGDKEGEVIIQTYNPSHYAIRFAQQQDYEGFYAYEMGIRRQLAYPPYFYTVGITLSHKDEEFVVRKSYDVMACLREHLSDKVTSWDQHQNLLPEHITFIIIRLLSNIVLRIAWKRRLIGSLI